MESDSELEEEKKRSRNEYEREILIRGACKAVEKAPKLKLIGAAALDGGKPLADLEFINTETDEYHVIEAKITYSNDRPNTVYKAIGQLLFECDRDLRVRAGKSAKVSDARAKHEGRIRYGLLILWETYSELSTPPSTVARPPHTECSGVDYYGRRFGEIPDATLKFGESFNIQDVFVLEANEGALYRMDWKHLPNASREKSTEHLRRV